MWLGFGAYVAGLQLVLDPLVLPVLVLGVSIGIAVGGLPGLTSTMGVALLTPLTYSLSPQVAFALLLGAYVGSIYGGSLSAILVRIPGTPASVMTVLDGYPMARRGESGRAVALATWASFFGGLGSAVFLALFAPLVASWAFEFSAQEFFAIAVLGVSVMAYISPQSLLKGLIAGLLGLSVSTVGTDLTTGYPRFTFGEPALLTGVEMIPVFIGMFGLVEVLSLAASPRSRAEVTRMSRLSFPPLSEVRRLLPVFGIAWVVGIFIGVVPAAGAAIASIIAYGVVKQVSPAGVRFGTGVPEGIIAAETANNGSTGGDLLPTLTLGVPGDAVTAVLIGAFLIHGLKPGPLLFQERPDIVAAIFVLMILANFLLLGLGLLAARVFWRVVRIPPFILLPVILILCVVGAYAPRLSFFDVGAMIVFGVLGYGMLKVGLPIPPFVLGIILGPLVETNLRRALILSAGDVTSFVLRPISGALLVVTVLILVSPYLSRALFGRSVRIVEEVDPGAIGKDS